MSVPNPATTDWVPVYAAGTQLVYEGDYIPATTYQDGDVVVKDGVAYMCVGGPTTVPPDISVWGQAALSVAGDELGYAELSANTPFTATTEAAAVTLVTAPPITLDGTTPIVVTFFAPFLRSGAVGQPAIIVLYDGSTPIGQLGQSYGSTSQNDAPMHASRRLTPSAGTHTYSARGYVAGGTGWVFSGTGGVGAVAPAFIRVSRIYPTPPQFPPAALTPVTYGTSLPASPADGQEAILVDSLTNPTYQWRFRFNASSTSAYKWEFVGGPPVVARVNTAEATSSAGVTDGFYVDLATVGPSFTLPRAGDYAIGFGMTISGATTQAIVSAMLFANNASTNIEAIAGLPVASYYYATSAEVQGNSMAAGVVKLKYRITVGSANPTTILYRWLRVLPVRVA